MKILMVHNFYQQPGGEDKSFLTEALLLENYGHQVIKYTVHNDDINNTNLLQLGINTIWNKKVYREIRKIIKENKIQLVHFQNTFPLISPAGYYAAKKEGAGVIQSIRNYRLICLNGLFHRDGMICENCINKKIPWPGIVHKCYRNNRMASSVVAAMLTFHRLKNTWPNMVDGYIALTNFVKKKCVEGGMPAHKIFVKPNFVYPDPHFSHHSRAFALYVGRLSHGKGIATLLKAWESLENIPLKIIGHGPMSEEVKRSMLDNSNIEWLGQQSVEEVYDYMGKAKVLVFPSEWYETFGRVTIEAFAKGTPVIVSNLGAIRESVDHERTGFYFRAGDHLDLIDKVRRIFSDHETYAKMQLEARKEYEIRYSAEKNYEMLMAIYNRILA